tara:strand:- start:45966 stop:46115 length:150 start_codon:yes stop_codon:yes gene_type:complete
MHYDFDSYTVDLLIETIQYRIENDEHLHVSPNLKADLEDLLTDIEDEYL